MTTPVTKTCAYEGCYKEATDLAYGRNSLWKGETGHAGVAKYCAVHADIVSDEGSPEYTVKCPNCGCGFGVN